MVNRFLQGTFILTVAGFIVKAIGSINWILLSRILGGEGIGIYQMAFPIYLLALNVSSAGIPVAISIVTAEKIAHSDYRGAQRIFKISFSLLCATGFFFSVLMYLVAHWLISSQIILESRAYYSLLALCPAIFLVTLLSCFRGYLQGWQQMAPTAISQIAEQIVRVIVMLAGAAYLLPHGLAYAAGGASMGAGAGALVALFVLFYFYRKLPAIPREAHFKYPQESTRTIVKKLIKLAIPISLASILLPFVSNLDLLIVPRRLEAAGFSTSEATELFGYLTGMAVPLVNLATILTASLATSLVPAISDALSRDDKDSIYFRVSGAMRLTFMATVPFSIMLYVLAEPIVTLIYNAPKAAVPTQTLAVAIFFLGLHQVTTGILQGLGKPSIPVINMALAAAIKVFLNWNLTPLPWLGITGSAYATVADIGFAALLNLFFVKKYSGYFLDFSILWKNIISASIMGISMFKFHTLVAPLLPSFLSFLVTAFLGSVIYIALMIIFKGLTRRDGERIPILKRWLTKQDGR